MAYRSLREFIRHLEKENELTRVQVPVSPYLEITEITDRIVKNRGKAILFENTGTEFPLLINMFGSEKRMCMSLGVNDLDDIGKDIEQLLKAMTGPKTSFLDKLRILPNLKKIASWMPVSRAGKGVCQEVIMPEPDLSILPVLTCWPADGGPFITLPMVHTKDPETGMRNLGMYRMQIMGSDLTGMHWHLHKGSASHFRKYKALGKKMPVTVTLGGDPCYTYCATAPLPENVDEYLFAGFLRKKKVELVKCLSNDLEVPSDVDFVIEGYVDPAEESVLEGPFGDHTGFYSLADFYPQFHITCITHRKDAVYPATIVGIPPMEDGWIGKATERIFLNPLKISAVPELIDMVMPEEGVFHNIAIAKIRSTYPGQALKVMNALWGAGQMMFNKIMIVTGEEVNIHNYDEVLKAILERTDPVSDIHFTTGPLDVLDHSGRKFAFGSKMGIDATGPVRSVNLHPEIQKDKIIHEFPEIKSLNADLSFVLILSVEKSGKDHFKKLIDELIKKGLIKDISYVIITDSQLEISKLNLVAWITAGNIDPERDCFVTAQTMVVDATQKTRADGFNREWPNVLVMDDLTIVKVDNRWNSYGLGQFLPSPSITIKPLVLNNKATV